MAPPLCVAWIASTAASDCAASGNASRLRLSAVVAASNSRFGRGLCSRMLLIAHAARPPAIALAMDVPARGLPSISANGTDVEVASNEPPGASHHADFSSPSLSPYRLPAD